MEFSTKLKSFEGPLDLLLHLIDKNKIDIYDIPISMITDQYLEYLDQMEKKDADITSEFLVMAATLLDIKAKMLIPKDEEEEGEEEDPRAELVERLLEYKLYKYMSVELKDKSISASKLLYKEATIPEEVAQYKPPVDLDRFLGDLTLQRLKAVFDDVMGRSSEKFNAEAMKFGTIQKDEVKIEDCITKIRKSVKKGKKISFRKMLERNTGKMQVIVTFLAVLELMKTGELAADQDGDDVVLYRPEKAPEAAQENAQALMLEDYE